MNNTEISFLFRPSLDLILMARKISRETFRTREDKNGDTQRHADFVSDAIKMIDLIRHCAKIELKSCG